MMSRVSENLENRSPAGVILGAMTNSLITYVWTNPVKEINNDITPCLDWRTFLVRILGLFKGCF